MAAGDTMQGRRLPDGYHYRDAEPGDYWRQVFGPANRPTDFSTAQRNISWAWTIRDPLGSMGTIGTHQVVEHEDGTITVSPSILNDRAGGWHGFLERGVWREV